MSAADEAAVGQGLLQLTVCDPGGVQAYAVPMRRLAAVILLTLFAFGCESGSRASDPTACVSQCGLNQVSCQQFCRHSSKDDCQEGCHEGYKVCVKACGAK